MRRRESQRSVHRVVERVNDVVGSAGMIRVLSEYVECDGAGNPGETIDFVYEPQIPDIGNGMAVIKTIVNDRVV